MNKIPKKLFSVLLALAMLVSLVPEKVFYLSGWKFRRNEWR